MNAKRQTATRGWPGRLVALGIAAAMLALALAQEGPLVQATVACAEEATSESTASDVVDSTADEQADADDEWAAYEPRVTEKEDGTLVRKTPYSQATGWGGAYPTDWGYYNTYVLNADNRGCTSCHSLEDALKLTMDDAIHPIYLGKYENEAIRYADCIACHYSCGVDLTDHMHAHMSNATFTAMGGTCLSCHYIQDDGSFVLWDSVKYDVMRGFTELASDIVNVDVTWDQDEVTPADKMFEVLHPETDYEFGYIERADDVYDQYTITFTGELNNPCELTIQQMLDMFGTVTRKQVWACAVNGTGGPYVYQAEVTGIPLNDVIDYLDPTQDAYLLDPVGYDGYEHGAMRLEAVQANDPILVLEMNGEELTDAQGYPVAMCYSGGISAGDFVRFVSEIKFQSEEDAIEEPCLANNYLNGVYGDYIDPSTGELVNCPNIGVLTAESGQIFAAGETVHLEGYAQAYDEPITKLEFSFDHGETWVEVDVGESDVDRWVYWKMDVSDLEAGSYLLELRATSLQADGTEHTNASYPQFLINVE